jgi:hypothetical protein
MPSLEAFCIKRSDKIRLNTNKRVKIWQHPAMKSSKETVISIFDQCRF